jgi:hypothetical protein
MTAGNLIGARLADRALMRTIYIAMACEILLAAGFYFADHNMVIAPLFILLLPATALALLPALQSRIVTFAGGAPNVAAASIHAAFNVANYATAAQRVGSVSDRWIGISNRDLTRRRHALIAPAAPRVVAKRERRRRRPKRGVPVTTSVTGSPILGVWLAHGESLRDAFSGVNRRYPVVRDPALLITRQDETPSCCDDRIKPPLGRFGLFRHRAADAGSTRH